MDIKQRLQSLMDERGWTIYRLARESEIPWTTISNVFKRDTEPMISTLERICNGLHISLAQFFDINNECGLTEEQRRILEQWNTLSSKEQKLVLDLLRNLHDR